MNRLDQLPVLSAAEAAAARRHGLLDESVRHPGVHVLLENQDGRTVARYVRVEGGRP